MNIKKLIVCSSAILVIATVALITSFIIVNRSEKDINEAQQIQHESLLLAEELRESSRELTAAVRKFTVTGDERYAEEYTDILLIRSGEKPRPDDREIAPGQLISLRELMIQSKLTKLELEFLQQSADSSDELAILEIEAMNAVRGMFPDGEGNYTIRGQPDKEWAISLIFSPEYDDEVAMIMRPFTLFTQMLNERLDNSVNAAQAYYNRSVLSSAYSSFFYC